MLAIWLVIDMVNKTFTKILSLGLGIVMVTSLLTVIVFHSYYEKQAQSNLKSTAILVSAEINANDDYSFINDVNNDTRLTIIDSNGTVLADSVEDEKNMESHADRPEFKEALQSGQGSTIRKSATIDQNTYYYAIKLANGNVLRVAVTSQSVFMVFYQSLIYIAIVSFVVMLLSLALSYAITKSIVKPITDIGNNLDNIEQQQETFEELTPFVNVLKEHKQKQNLLDKQKKEFTANVSHELKTPLTSIAGYAELIETGMAKEDDIKPFAHTIRKQALRLVALTEDIIQLSQLDETQPENISFEEINLSAIAEGSAESLEMNARAKNVEISLELEECFIDGNASLIEEMVYNLIDNAIRYNNDNGSVKVTVEKPYGNKVVLCVEDTGIGIPEEYQKRVFERFFRVDKSRSKATGGTGLGLAIVKHIAEVHDAKIAISSEEGIGTQVKIEFN